MRTIASASEATSRPWACGDSIVVFSDNGCPFFNYHSLINEYTKGDISTSIGGQEKNII